LSRQASCRDAHSSRQLRMRGRTSRPAWLIDV